MRRFHALTSLLLSACGMDFAPASLLDEPRVLAMIPNPIEVDFNRPEVELEIERVLYVPATATVTRARWSFCPISSGVRGGFACVLPECQSELDESEPGRVRVSPVSLALLCLERLEASGLSFGTQEGEPPASIETSFRLRLETDVRAPVEAVARVRAFFRDPPSPPRGHPVFRQITIAGRDPTASSEPLGVREGESLELELTLEPGAGSSAEALYVSYYATAGRFERLRTDLAAQRNTWTAEELGPEDDHASIYLVARDGAGGQAVAGPFSVEIDRAAP